MKHQRSPLFWSFPIGTWFFTQVSVSVFLPLVALILCFKFGLQLGLVLSIILFVSILCHELIGHVLVARMTGGSGDEVLIWPLGGLAFVQPAKSFTSQFLTPAGGPIVNLMLCGLASPVFWFADASVLRIALNPLVVPAVDLSDPSRLVVDLGVLCFAVNWALFLVNLIPVHPLDGGRMLQAGLATRLSGSVSTEVYIRIGFVVAIIMLVTGLMFEELWVVAIGSIVLALNIQESMQLRMGESYDESFMGYDFSQGYTSLERTSDAPPAPRKNFWQRRKEKRDADRVRREQVKDQEVEIQLDVLLDKVHSQGMDALTEAERRQLNRASDRFRRKRE